MLTKTVVGPRRIRGFVRIRSGSFGYGGNGSSSSGGGGGGGGGVTMVGGWLCWGRWTEQRALGACEAVHAFMHKLALIYWMVKCVCVCVV